MNNKTHQSLFHESLSDALKEVIQAAGGSKSVACKLWPEKTPDSAHRTLLDALNENRAEKLSPEQVLFLLRIGREVGCHAAVNYMARESGYSDPQPVEPEDEKASLMREFIAAQKSMAMIAERLGAVGLRGVA
jgi:hypothetical protein